MTYLITLEVIIHEEALYEVYVRLPLPIMTVDYWRGTSSAL